MSKLPQTPSTAYNILLAIWHKDQLIHSYAFKLYARAGGKSEQLIHNDSYVVNNSELLRKCYAKAEKKYI